MKVNEIVVESKAKLRKGAENSLSNVSSYPYLDNNNHPYLAYRFGIALAKSPNSVSDHEGPIGSEFTTIGYSDVDQEIIERARKEFGIKKRAHSSSGSKELSSINKTSPVAPRKKNKYGV